MKPAWKEASTLILTALKKSSVNSNCNYKLLTVQRSSQSSFMPNGHVFPGGTTEPSDSNKEWLNFFSNFNLDMENVTKITGKIPPIIEQEGLQIPKLLSLKIAAVRETFEETGILLCICKDSKSGLLKKWVSYNTFEGLDSWRIKVQEDASEFYRMCQSYNCCPDVDNLHLWSNWLTPTSKGKKRFDAAFFIACLHKNPVAIADNAEVEKLSWVSPDKVIGLNKAKEIWLPPPQFYEIARLLQFKDIEALSTFAFNRSANGCERWMPVQIKTSNGMVSVLPGDDVYGIPDYSKATKPAEVEMSNEEFRSQAKVLHRMEFVNVTETKVIVKNYNPTCGHVLPVGECLK